MSTDQENGIATRRQRIISTLESLMQTLVAGYFIPPVRGYYERASIRNTWLENPVTLEEWPTNTGDYFNQARQRAWGCTMSISTDQRLGLAARETESGDVIAILYGLNTPAILRKRDDGGYTWFGDAYIHGVMDGEAMMDLEKGFYREETFELR
jgi:hypothetical protein